MKPTLNQAGTNMKFMNWEEITSKLDVQIIWVCSYLHREPEDAVKQKGSDAFLLKFKPSLLALLPLQPGHAHVEDDDHPGGEDELVQQQFFGDDSAWGARESSIKPGVPSIQKWREDKGAHYGVALHTWHI